MSNGRKIRTAKRFRGATGASDGGMLHIWARNGRTIGVVPVEAVTFGANREATIDPADVRPPGLGGDYAGTCVGCCRPTDTLLALMGPPEFHVAALMVWGGTGMEYADMMYRAGLDDLRAKDGTVAAVVDRDTGEAVGHKLSYRVCGACAARTHMEARLAGGPILMYPWAEMPPGAFPEVAS